ncbi:MAG: DUF4416 family protein [Thermoguttaceae bacterium]|nr:DUF4416 family protein [Thermoguttaceae bacterium]MBR5757745.1 DUF4416 family protein [Thermoguttaceae bacterium]
MGEIRKVKPVLLLIAAFGVDEEALALGKARVEREFGPIAMESPTYRFDDFTRYYDKEMGAALPKRFWIFERLADPGDLAAIKIKTNAWEEEIGAKLYAEGKVPTPRPLNLDPGYIELGKLILASTKDHAHRIYLRDGIFAETTLMYAQKQWKALPWSYADYQDPKNQEFFSECRIYLKKRFQEEGVS